MHLSLVQLEGKKMKIKNNNQIQRNIFKEVHKGDSFKKYIMSVKWSIFFVISTRKTGK